MLDVLIPRNESTTDRVIRVVLGTAILMLAFFGPKTPFALIGLVPLLTGVVGSCPLYRLFGLSTCPVSLKK